MDSLKQQTLADIESAAQFLSQAIARLHPSLDICKELREVDNLLDSVRDALVTGDYEIGGAQ